MLLFVRVIVLNKVIFLKLFIIKSYESKLIIVFIIYIFFIDYDIMC